MEKSEKEKQQLTTLGLVETSLEKEIKYRNGTFKIKVLLPYEKSYIIKLISDQLGNASALLTDELDYVRKICTLQVCIKEYPEWWEGAGKCIDEALLDELYEAHLKLEADIQSQLKKNRAN